LAGFEQTAIVEPGLAEWDYGDYEGKRSVDIRKERPDWNVFRDGCPGGETPTQISDRADSLIGKCLGMEGNVALFSHGHFGCVLATRWIGLNVTSGHHFALEPASISILGYKVRDPEVRVITLWNEGQRHIRQP
jgi:probable phosphoglycerate mutase